jgi:hypothetical protein
MGEKKKNDPVGNGKAGKEETALVGIGEESKVTASKSEKVAVEMPLNFKPIPQKAAKIRRPFDGYPMKDVKIGEAKTYATYVVALNPTVQVKLDPANHKVKTKDGMVQVKNYHSRMIRNMETRNNEDVVFDRLVEVGGQEYACAIIPSHNVRAQICFSYNSKSKRIDIDSRYLMLDTEQGNRLREVFQQVINPKIKMERQAQFISGESQEDAGEVKPLTENEV